MASYFCSSSYHRLVPVSCEPPSFTKPSKAPFTVSLVCTRTTYKQSARVTWWSSLFCRFQDQAGRDCTVLQRLSFSRAAMISVGLQFPSARRRDTVAKVARRLCAPITAYWPNCSTTGEGQSSNPCASPSKR